MATLSAKIYQKALSFIPGGVNSPVRACRSVGVEPLMIDRAEKDLLFDADGSSYIDFCNSWGALILGHAPESVCNAVVAQMKKGSSYGVPSVVEAQLAEKVVSIYPSVEKIRFVSSGTEATMTAIRLARGYTNRKKIIKFSGCYHGHSDALLSQAGSGAAFLNAQATSLGVTQGAIADTINLPFNSIFALQTLLQDKELSQEIAAVIVEPIPANMGLVLPERSFLDLLQSETKRIGALLIFDEVITGFRVSLQGAQGLYSILPDVTCFGKIIGGGFPVAAVGGRREILDYLSPLGQVYQAGTLSGNPVAMHAGLATIQELEKPGFYEEMERKTDRLVQPIEELLLEKNFSVCIQRKKSMFTLFFGPSAVRCREDLQQVDTKRFARFFRYLLERGVYIPPLQQEAWFISSAHTDEHLDQTARLVIEFLKSGA